MGLEAITRTQSRRRRDPNAARIRDRLRELARHQQPSQQNSWRKLRCRCYPLRFAVGKERRWQIGLGGSDSRHSSYRYGSPQRSGLRDVRRQRQPRKGRALQLKPQLPLSGQIKAPASAILPK